MNIGIIAHYYRSENYGGNLQAYALCAALKALGYNSEQICLDRKSGNGLASALRLKLIEIKTKC